MAPMVATVEEAAAFVALCRDHGIERAGIMIETPAAALSAPELAEAVDFVSLGTNDLTQYTMAADRQLGELAELNDPWQPAVLRLIRTVGSAGRRLRRGGGRPGARRRARRARGDLPVDVGARDSARRPEARRPDA